MANDSPYPSSYPKQLAVPLPHRFKLEQRAGRLNITGPSQPWPVGTSLFLLAWIGLTLFFSLWKFWNGLYFEACVLLGGSVVGLALLLSLLPAYLNRTEVMVTANQLQIKQGPLRPKQFGFETAKIKQVYLKEERPFLAKNKRKNPYYDLYLLTHEGYHLKILAGLSGSDQALYLEQEIERSLGLVDQEILPEAEVDEGEGDKYNAWRLLAERHHLAFTPRSALKGSYVSGQYRGHYLELDSLVKRQAGAMKISTRLLVLARPGQTPGSRSDTSILDEVAALLERPLPSFPIEGLIQFEEEGQAIRYEQKGFETREVVLQFLFDALVDLIKIYPRIVALGGKMIPLLQEKSVNDKRPFHKPIRQLLEAIAAETTARLAGQAPSLRCADCLGRCAAHPLTVVSLDELTYYGCQSCFQSQNFIHLEGQVIALLDNRLETDRAWQGNHLQVNWLAHLNPFSFEAVEIIQATDEEVERFVVQVGNDTDPVRQPRYRTLPCRVSAACSLSQNTLRILERTFGRVEIIPPEGILS